jgi:citrate lyase subunit beta/citryl-CoA lyase
MIRPLTARSYLFAPGHKPHIFAKAVASGADMVILDLEDAVAPDAKAGARDAIAAWLSADTPVAVRINGTDTSWWEEDLAICQHPGVAVVVVPKAEDPDALKVVAARLPPGVRLLPQIESARGLQQAGPMAEVPAVERLAFGALDFQLDLDLGDDPDALLVARSQLVLVSRLAGRAAPVDGVTTSWDSADAVETDSRRARALGFGGKLCIHPKQVPWVNACFSPSARDVAWATRVVEADQASGGHATVLDGQMIDRPVVERARAILARTTR